MGVSPQPSMGVRGHAQQEIFKFHIVQFEGI